jgi:queuine tRNA-ribosyltransferase
MNQQFEPQEIFRTIAPSPNGRARTGRVVTPHGEFRTPAFMPVGTQATVKGLFPKDVAATGAEIILSNTFHLHLRPGEKLVEELGGLHRFMGWSGPILTDSGGFQVWSLSDIRKIEEDGVRFKSPIDGAHLFLGPKEAMEIQTALGSDIIMSFDECIPYPVDYAYAEASVDRTTRWERETLAHHPRNGRALFAIVQGSVFPALRKKSATALLDMPFDGYAMGGLFIGEERGAALDMLELVGGIVPDRYPRYVMGVGTPLEIVDCVDRGWDMFDCVLPTRNARHGQGMSFSGPLKLKNAACRSDRGPIEEGCPCIACRDFSRAYIRHLLVADEILAASLVSIHNLTFMQRLMQEIRDAIPAGRLGALRERLAAHWRRPNDTETS